MSSGEDTLPIHGLTGAARATIGSRIGRYVVLEEVGHGGMGRVLRAYDPKLQREVALKEVRSEVLGAAGARRLVAEARAMAKLSHPNVVAVYDVEAIAGDEVVLVMEYVHGRSLTAWLEQPRTWQETLACFRRAGRGLAAAHAAGLLHRDFKPDNVLVGDDGRVRVTDFGLAREILTDPTDEQLPLDAPTPELVDDVGRTATGTILGTLPYLAPERLLAGPADAGTDQFAYCVSLWEALFGARPFAGRSAVELAFAMAAGTPQPPAGAPRVPTWLVEAMTRGLASDARARWPSMTALLDALAHDPAERRRRWVQLGAALAVIGVGGFGVHAWSSARAQRCSVDAAAEHLVGAWDDERRAAVQTAVLGIGADYATSVWTRTEQTLDGYADAWTQMHVESCEATTVRGEQSAAVMDLRMACLHRAEVELTATTDVLAHADAQTVHKAHELLSSLRPLSRCADVDALQADVEPPLPEQAEAVEAIRAEVATAMAALRAGHHEAARRAVEAADVLAQTVEYGPVKTELANAKAFRLHRMGEYDEAVLVLQEAMRNASRWHQWGELQMAATLMIHVLGSQLRRFDEALGYVPLAEGLADGDPEREARVDLSVGSVLFQQSKYVEAEAKGREALARYEATPGIDPVQIAVARTQIAIDLDLQAKYRESEAEHRAVLELRERELGTEHPDVAYTLMNLSAVIGQQGRFPESEQLARRGLAILEASLGAEHPDVATSHSNLAVLRDSQRDYAGAVTEHRLAVAIAEQARGPDHPAVALSRHNLAVALRVSGELEESESEHRRALAVQEQTLGADHHHVAGSHHNLAKVLRARHEPEQAEAEYRLALRLLEAALGREHPDVAACRTDLAIVLFERGAIDESRALAEASWVVHQREDVPAAFRGDTSFVLARTLWNGGDAAARTRARELAEQAVLAYTECVDPQLDMVRAWLASHPA